jgi:hypothetical protein
MEAGQTLPIEALAALETVRLGGISELMLWSERMNKTPAGVAPTLHIITADGIIRHRTTDPRDGRHDRF